MWSKTLKAVAYAKAPRATFTLSHPRTALRLKALEYQMRHTAAPRIAGIAAAAVALPLGILLGAKLNGRKEDRAAD